MRCVGALAVLALLAGGCSRSEAAPSQVRVEKAWARVTPAQVGAVYLTVVGAAQEDRLLSAESPAAQRVEFHEVVPRGDLLQMIPRPEGFGVPAGGRVVLSPGGKHLMLYAVRPGLERSIELTLHFQYAGAVRLSVPVTPPGEDPP